MSDEQVFARYRDIIDDWDAFKDAIARPLPTTIWANPLRISPPRLRELLGRFVAPLSWGGGGFRASRELRAGHHWAYMAGLYHIQEEVSMIPTSCLDLRAGQSVIDLCAAPGNKSAQIGTHLQNSGIVVSNDRSMKRARASRHTLERLGLLNVTTTICDAIHYPAPARAFDRVLVDAPCTGEGTCRKVRARRWRVSVEASQRIARQQLAILRNAVRLCRPGGRIVYSTCTFAPEENECVVDALMRDPPAPLRLLPARVPGFDASPGLTSWEGRALHPQLHTALRIWPHQNDTGGFFVAVLERSDGPAADAPSEARPFDHGVEEAQPWLDQLSERFGIDPARLADCLIFRAGTKDIYVTNRAQRSARGITPDAVGMRFMHTGDKYPKLTTSAAMHFGDAATRNVLELSPEQARAYMGRIDFTLRPEQASACTSTGYLLLRYRGYTLGVGLFHQRSGQVESYYPKAWSRAVRLTQSARARGGGPRARGRADDDPGGPL